MKQHKFDLPEEGLTDKQKEKLIKTAAKHYAKYMDVLLPGWEKDPNSKDTPHRVAKAFVNDIAKGLYNAAPKFTNFENADEYPGSVIQTRIEVKSLCAHHHLSFTGYAYVGYIPNPKGKIIGLSKLNRIVDLYARTPQVQENLTQQIHNAVNEICEGNLGVAVLVRAEHSCVSCRGIGQNSEMFTARLTGGFDEEGKVRSEFFKMVELSSK